MKVLYVSSNGGIHDYRFLKKLSADHEVLFLHYAASEIIDEIDKLDNLQIISKKPAFRSMPVISEKGHFKRVVNEFKPDVIHSGYVWQAGILAAGYHPHLSMPWGSDILLEPGKNFFIRRLVKKVLTAADHIQCDAEFVKLKIITDYNIPQDRITVFPWGIDLKLFSRLDKPLARKELKLPEDKFIVIFNRHFENIYGVNFLLEAFKKFSENKSDILLLMLSEGSLKVDALKFITENNLDTKITLLGRVANKELPVLLNASDVYVSPSLSDGTSLSLLEAMACGTGLVVTDVPAIKEWVNDENGIMVKRESSDELAEAIERYYNNRELIRTHGVTNRRIAEQRADWDKNYLKLTKIYENMTGSSA